MIKQIEKQFNNIITLTNKIPSEIEMTEDTYGKLVQECLDMKIKDFTEVLDKEGNPISRLMRNENYFKQ